ncbi:MAG: hypothetical protein DMG65_17445 [Candidatus Angelobacter sp. Gp1-AA117]|nr:MAG: hypothetical protein DMG65_17445 [Candidatus Angelobacter sp. Gp1-AA117]
MRKSIAVLFLLAGLVLAQTDTKTGKKSTATRKGSATDAIVVTPDTIQWAAAPPTVPAGAKMAVLSGNPNGTGQFAVRLKLPDGYRIMPHWHPTTENVTVLSGEFRVGMGNKFDESKLQALPAGSYASVPAHHNHYAMAKGETELQITAMGPFKVNYVNPADDPSRKK